IRRAAWTGIGAQSVIKGSVRTEGDEIAVELRLYKVSESDQPALVRTYRGAPGDLRLFVHRFGNEVLETLFGRPGAFDTQIAYAKRVEQGRKDIIVSDYDGNGAQRVSAGDGVAMLPGFGGKRLWYSRLT